MKKLAILLTGSLLVFGNTGCRKDTICSTCNTATQDTLSEGVTSPTTPTIPPPERSVKLMLPNDWVVFNASYLDPAAIVDTMTILKMSGPDSYHTWNSNERYAVLSGLEKGKYQFEWTIKYTNGIIVKDTLDVTLYDVSDIPENAKETVLTNIPWTNPWYSEVEVKDFYKIVSPDSHFRIFIKRDGTSTWEDVSGSTTEYSTVSYDYFIERRLPDGAGMYTNGSLFITVYGSDPKDTPDVKIVYW